MEFSRWRWLLAVLALPLAAAPAYGQTPGFGEESRFEIEIRRWRPALVSELELGGASTPVSPSQDLGVGDEREIEYRVFLRLARRLKVRGSRVAFEYEGATSLGTGVSFAGLDFPPGAVVETTLPVEQIKGGVEVDLVSHPYGFLAVVADISRLEARPELVSADVGMASGGPIRVQLLTLGLRGRVYLTPALSLTAEASGMKRESEGVITDVEGVITYNLSRNFALSFGYRNSYTRWNEGGDRATFRLRGNFFSVSFRI
ncbi:MAG: hypothetical protein ACE5JI_18560 [Acidobacteriota bacterium]